MNDVLANILLMLVCTTPFCIGGLAVLGIAYLIYSHSNKRKKDNVNVIHQAGAKPMAVNLESLEKKQFSGWDLIVEGEATVLVGDDLVVSGPIVGLKPIAASYDNPRFGRVEMGGVPGAGYTQYSYKEHRSGVIDVAYAIKDGQLLLGYFLEPRFLTTIGGKSVSLAGMPGGFSDPGEDALTAAKRELENELGLDADIFPLVDEIGQELPGIIANRAFSVDRDGQNANRYFGLKLDGSVLFPKGDGTYVLNFAYTPKDPPAEDKTPEANAKRNAIKNAKAVAKLTFVPWAHFGLLGRDGLIQSGAFRIVSMWFLGLLPGMTKTSAINHEVAGK